MTVGDYIIGRLHAWGVRRIYGYSGDGVNGIIAAIDRASDKLDFVQVRHEEQAAFMACAHAKFTGELGVCVATSGPGAIHLLNGLYDAKADHVPVLALVGQSATYALGTEFQQEVDLQTLFKDVAPDYDLTIVDPAQARHAVDRAVRSSLSARSVTALIVPRNVQEMKAVDAPPRQLGSTFSGIGYERPRIVPHDDALGKAAAVLNAGKRVAMLVGAGAIGATDEVIALAGRLQAGSAKALLGKSVIPDDLPWVTGTLGLLGTEASSEMMAHCDTLLLIGTNFPYAMFLPKEGQARGVEIEVDGRRIGNRYPTEVNLQGDVADTITALLPLIEPKTDTSWREQIARNREHSARVNEARTHIDGAGGINPEIIFTTLAERLPDDVILTADAGTSTNFAARHLPLRRGMKFSLSGGLATMGSAVPYAIAAKFAFPERVAIALTGDGAMQMNGMLELITVARYWKTWSDPRLIFMVNNNRDLAQVSWEMRIESGEPKFPGSQTLPDIPYARYAELLGFVGIRVERPEDMAAGWDAALRADRPVVLEVLTDANVPFLPAHITPEQARAFTSAMLHGDPDAASTIVQSAKT
ncbi:MAG: thiamine pyrophosphate-requiring protein, partial [Candidatus Eremiobacteraeota bacterium]|nr:thiamine pyrophosphate-requiring protein [Candidatus Eremiobacteraeota bacterium]